MKCRICFKLTPGGREGKRKKEKGSVVEAGP